MSRVGAHNELAAAALMDELFRCGVREVCLSPGGRSTPLAVALARHRNLRAWVIPDERDSAFFALGIAIATDRPVAVVCTSGSAAANFLPAVVEAFWSELPLILLTADRPVEQRDCGAAQTIRQAGLFTGHVKWSVEAAAPDDSSAYEAHVRALTCRAVGMAMAPACGPVHINVPYREPLTAEGTSTLPASVRGDGRAYAVIHAPQLVPAADAVDRFVSSLPGAKGLIVCGPRIPTGSRAAIVELARHISWPVLADPLSGLRHGRHDRDSILDAYDVMLRDADFVTQHRPTQVLHFGATPTSKPLHCFLAGLRVPQTLVTTSAWWGDSSFVLSDVIGADASHFCRAVVSRLPKGTAGDSHWQRAWIAADRSVRQAITDSLAIGAISFEGGIAACLAQALPDGGLLMVGNSMPVRDVDTFAGGSARDIRIVANRGANGIDGVLATAMGIAATHGGPCCLLLGDLSFLHDIGALQIAARYPIALCVVVANNDGGGIFSFLPQAQLGEVFEPFFGTPHGLELGTSVRMCGGRHERVSEFEALTTAVSAHCANPSGLQVLEVPTHRDRNVVEHRRIVAQAASVLHGLQAKLV